MSPNEVPDTWHYDTLPIERLEDYLTPQQRAEAIAEILITIALRVVKETHEKQGKEQT